MNQILCHECKEVKKVVGFKRDDPLLECGHAKQVEDFGDALFSLCITKIMEGKNVSYDEAVEILSED